MFDASNEEKAYFGPFAVFIVGESLFGLITWLFEGSRHWALSTPQYWIYPLQTAAAGWVLIRCWRRYEWGRPARPLLTAAFATAIGIAVFALWVAPGLWLQSPRALGFDPAFFAGRATYALNLAMRGLRLVIVAPLAEEIFWRGFLYRYLIRPQFLSVPFGTFAWKAFLVTTAGFCLEHRLNDWPAALLTGALYNWVATSTRSLADCVLAHAVTNLALGFYVLATHEWGYW